MTDKAKRNSLILLGLVMLITMIIAAGLPRLELQPGMPPPELENKLVVIPSAEEQPVETISVTSFFLVFFALLSVVSTLLMLYKLIRGASWKSIPTLIGQLFVISLIVTSLVFLIMMLPRSESSLVTAPPVPSPEPLVRSPLGSVPSVLFWLIGLGLLAAVTLIGIWIFGSTLSRASAIDVVGLEAEKAWQELKTGVGLKGVIIKCYRQMSLALEKEQKIERKETMTTREFEDVLEAAGFPYDPIHQLTRLFEAVRYGNWQPTSMDEQNAIQCLEAIMLFSRRAKDMN